MTNCEFCGKDAAGLDFCSEGCFKTATDQVWYCISWMNEERDIHESRYWKLTPAELGREICELTNDLLVVTVSHDSYCAFLRNKDGEL